MNFNANGMYDPYASGSGHQPMGFDQWMTFYNHYTVVQGKITLKINESGTPLIFGINLADDVIGSSDPELLREQGNSVFGMSGQDSPRTLVKRFDAQKFFNKEDIVSASQFQGNVSQNPSEVAVYQCWASAHDASSTTSIRAQIVIEYLAVFTEPKELGQS